MSTNAQDIIRAILKCLGFMSLIFIAVFSTFGWFNAHITNELLVLCAFIFIFSVLPEVKNWNIWGFRGESKDLSTIPTGNGVSERSETLKQIDIQNAEKKPIQLMDNALGNFLMLAFEIERLLRILASLVLKKAVSPKTNLKALLKELHENGIVTDNGKAQVEAVTEIRNLIVHGRNNEVTTETLNAGISIAFSFYMELFNWLNNPQNTHGTK